MTSSELLVHRHGRSMPQAVAGLPLALYRLNGLRYRIGPSRRDPKGGSMRLSGKIGIVTAAASGMGRAGALRFAKEGAQVAVVDVDSAGVQRVVNEIAAAGGAAHGIVADLTKDEDARRIVWETVGRFKGL